MIESPVAMMPYNPVFEWIACLIAAKMDKATHLEVQQAHDLRNMSKASLGSVYINYVKQSPLDRLKIKT